MNRARVGNAHIAVESWSVSVPKFKGFVWMTLRGTASDASTARMIAAQPRNRTTAVSVACADIVLSGSAFFDCAPSKVFEVGKPIPEAWSVTCYFWFPERPSMVRP